MGARTYTHTLVLAFSRGAAVEVVNGVVGGAGAAALACASSVLV